METTPPKVTYSSWVLWSGGIVYSVSGVILLVGKLFYCWPVDSVALILFLIIWIPLVLPLIRRLKYKDLEIEFIERAVKQVQAEIATLANQTEIVKDEKSHALQDIKVDPYKIRIRHTSERVDEKYFRVRVWLDAPQEFIPQVKKVIYERHPTFKKRFKETTVAPFEDTFKCWGEFTIRAKIELGNGELLRRQRYLSLEEGQTEASDDI